MFLIEQIREQKLLEMEVSIDQFLEENSISDSAIIHTMTFDKEVFAEEKEVREYLKDKFVSNPAITDNGDKFTAVLLPSAQIDAETEITVEIRRGVMVVAGDLVPVMMEEVMFNDKGEVNLSSKFGSIDLSLGLPYIIEIAKVAEGEHPAYGKLKITQEHLESMVNNFRSRVTGVDLSVNEDHKKNEAFGWFKDIFLSHDNQTLYGQIVWNKKGTQALSEKEYRYFSPEFRFNYTHPHSGVEHGPTLLGGALTNYPFLKMEAITELNNKNNSQGEKPVSNETIELSVHNAQIVELNNKVVAAESKATAAEQKNIELSDKVKELETKIEKQEKESLHEKLFNENKISKAQLVALNEGKGMLEVLALNENLNTESTGTDEAPKDKETVELSGKEKEFAANLGLTEEEYIKYNK